jgi:hypothetical protein
MDNFCLPGSGFPIQIHRPNKIQIQSGSKSQKHRPRNPNLIGSETLKLNKGLACMFVLQSKLPTCSKNYEGIQIAR